MLVSFRTFFSNQAFFPPDENMLFTNAILSSGGEKKDLSMISECLKTSLFIKDEPLGLYEAFLFHSCTHISAAAAAAQIIDRLQKTK